MLTTLVACSIDSAQLTATLEQGLADLGLQDELITATVYKDLEDLFDEGDELVLTLARGNHYCSCSVAGEEALISLSKEWCRYLLPAREYESRFQRRHPFFLEGAFANTMMMAKACHNALRAAPRFVTHHESAAKALAEKLERLAEQGFDSDGLALSLAAELYEKIDRLGQAEKALRTSLEGLPNGTFDKATGQKLALIEREGLIGKEAYAWLALAGVVSKTERLEEDKGLGNLFSGFFAFPDLRQFGGHFAAFASNCSDFKLFIQERIRLERFQDVVWASRRALTSLQGEAGFSEWLEVKAPAGCSELIEKLEQDCFALFPYLKDDRTWPAINCDQANWNSQVESIKELAADYPEATLLTSHLANSALTFGDLETARILTDRAVSGGAIVADPYLLDVTLKIHASGDYQANLELARLAVEKEPHHPQALSMLSLAHLRVGDYEKSYEVASCAARYACYHPRPWSALAQSHMKRGQYQPAVSYFSYRIKNGVGDATDYQNRSFCHAILGDFQSAQDDLNAAAEHPYTAGYAGLSLALAGDKKQAKKLIKKYLGVVDPKTPASADAEIRACYEELGGAGWMNKLFGKG